MAARQVVVVDDNEITLTGCAALLDLHQDIKVVAAIDHTEALRRSDWAGVEVVVVDAADERCEDEQFPGVRVVEQLRASRLEPSPVIVVLTGHYLNDALRRRMHEAGADFFYSRSEAMDGDALQRVVLHPDDERRVPPPRNPQELAALGITDGTRINAFVRSVNEAGVNHVLAGGTAKKHGPLPARSRWWNRLRAELTRASGLQPVNTDGSLPRREQDLPSISQFRRVYEWATRVTPGERDAYRG